MNTYVHIVVVKLINEDAPCYRADSIYQGGQNPEWTSSVNRDLEIYWNEDIFGQGKDQVMLEVQVWNASSHEEDDLLGIGQVNVGHILTQRDMIARPTEYTVSLKERLVGGKEKRGQVFLNVTYGAPVRKAFRALERSGKVLQLRDAFLHSAYLAKHRLATHAWERSAGVREYIKENKKMAIAAAGVGGLVLLGFTAIVVIIAGCIAGTAVVTMPLWIIPAILASVATAPIWVPLLAGVVLVGLVLLGCGGMFALTSEPVRKRGKLVARQMKDSKIGQRLVYEQP